MPTEPKEPRKSRPLSPLDPPEVIEGVFKNMDRLAEKMKAERAAKGLPPAEELTADECAAIRRAFLGHATRAARPRYRPRSA